MLKLYMITLCVSSLILFNSCNEEESNITTIEEGFNTFPIADSKNVTLLDNEKKIINLTGFDNDGDILSYEILILPEYGTLSGNPPTLTYTPNPNFVGNDNFEFRVNDGFANSNSAIVGLSIGSINISNETVRVSGKITYDLIGVNSNNRGLDFDNIKEESAKGVLVEAINNNDEVITNIETSKDGEYFFDIKKNTSIKIRVSARLLHTGNSSWDMKVVDNTNSDALYVMEGSLLNVGIEDSFRDLHAPSGLDGNIFSKNRTAAPFAILDTVYKCIQKVLTANSHSSFSHLSIKWSPKNISTEGRVSLGQIGTSHYENSTLFILGDIKSDTDEYDRHVIAHEWGHYYEDRFSRTDSIGGNHGDKDSLDIRVAFSEGFGNAFAGIVLDDPIYFDTLFSVARNKSGGFFFDLESDNSNLTKGWFTEGSVQRILYDIYDENSDGLDNLSLGFTPIHNVFLDRQKNTPAFTSIFSFINGLKEGNPQEISKIDTLISSEDIASIDDDYGTGRKNRKDDYPYLDLIIGQSLNTTLSSDDGEFNKLSNIKYIKFTIKKENNYTIKVKQTNGSNSDPDFYLYTVPPSNPIVHAESFTSGIETKTLTLTKGDYLLEIRDAENVKSSNFNILIK